MYVRDLPQSSRALAGLLPRLAVVATAAYPTMYFGGCLSHDALPTELRVYNALVVKYNASAGLDRMEAHGDHSLLTINIALSAGHEGGGTWFKDALCGVGEIGRVVQPPDVGHAVIHPGALWHSGAVVTAGCRYILVVFLQSVNYVDHTQCLLERATTMVEAVEEGEKQRPILSNPATVHVVKEAARMLGMALRTNPKHPSLVYALKKARRKY